MKDYNKLANYIEYNKQQDHFAVINDSNEFDKKLLKSKLVRFTLSIYNYINELAIANDTTIDNISHIIDTYDNSYSFFEIKDENKCKHISSIVKILYPESFSSNISGNNYLYVPFRDEKLECDELIKEKWLLFNNYINFVNAIYPGVQEIIKEYGLKIVNIQDNIGVAVNFQIEGGNPLNPVPKILIKKINRVYSGVSYFDRTISISMQKNKHLWVIM